MTQPFVTTRVLLKNLRGLHARAAAKIVKTVEDYNAEVFIQFKDKEVVASSIMGLMFLGARTGDYLILKGSGQEAKDALDALQHLIEEKFSEED